ncbi:hypothetical protein Zmor_018445 [Zophobas morio]|uniref:Uncharacterized protein n=1 Tax=Zophobas morio TaxID=2755281 RepID=A0AA38IE90_9CUCU|nr:hypothetical protein Zmor_018445 [Zophobas morio]
MRWYSHPAKKNIRESIDLIGEERGSHEAFWRRSWKKEVLGRRKCQDVVEEEKRSFREDFGGVSEGRKWKDEEEVLKIEIFIVLFEARGLVEPFSYRPLQKRGILSFVFLSPHPSEEFLEEPSLSCLLKRNDAGTNTISYDHFTTQQ